MRCRAAIIRKESGDGAMTFAMIRPSTGVHVGRVASITASSLTASQWQPLQQRPEQAAAVSSQSAEDVALVVRESDPIGLHTG